MSRSLKFKNNNYLDSAGIVHKRELLSSVLESKVSKSLDIYSGDLNNIKETGFLYASGTCPNSPIIGYAWYVTIIAINSNYVIQIAYMSDADTPITYERQCKGGNWTAWNYSSFGYMAVIGTSDNFNTIIRSGIYKYGGNAVANRPPNWGVVEVINSDGYVLQRCSNDGKISTRISYDNGTSWNAWKSITLT